MLKRGPRKHCRAPHQSNPGSISFPKPPRVAPSPSGLCFLHLELSIRLRVSMASPGSLDSPPGQAGCGSQRCPVATCIFEGPVHTTPGSGYLFHRVTQASRGEVLCGAAGLHV